MDHPECDSKTLPFLCEWFTLLRRNFSINIPQQFMVIVALELAFVCLLRVSELIVTAEEHFIRACDVCFGMKLSHNSDIISWVSPAQAHLFHLRHLHAVSIKIRSAKNDEGGRGYKYYFVRNLDLSASAAFDLVVDLFVLSSMCRPEGTASFFSMDDWVLPYSHVNEAVKRVARDGKATDVSRFSCHSLRIGGATVLAAAHMPDFVIQNMGRWRSLEFLHYLHWAPSTMARAMASLVDPNVFTLQDLNVLNSGVELNS